MFEGAVSYSYDQNGNTIQETNGAQITKYIYNTSNRLERVELPDGRIAEYKYDPFGRRISKTINNQTTYYLYSDEGLIGEYDSAGNIKKSYGWMPDSIWGTNPVFMLENNNYYFYHNDHLGTPQKMTDINGNVVWSATYTSFGEATVDVGSTITNNLRFPGQYFDEETGKHYNWNRYYDPKTGRYTQVDPIGFAGGDGNLYRYVKNSPVNFVDAFGLKSVGIEGVDFAIGIYSYFRGIFRGIRAGLRYSGQLGECEKKRAEQELEYFKKIAKLLKENSRIKDIGIKAGIDIPLGNDDLRVSDVAMEFRDLAMKLGAEYIMDNWERSWGRLITGAIMSRYSRVLSLAAFLGDMSYAMESNLDKVCSSPELVKRSEQLEDLLKALFGGEVDISTPVNNRCKCE